MPPDFDFAILGGGAAGLSLALALKRSPLQGKSILVVEKDPKTSNDRTWCFWTDSATPLEPLARRVWNRLAFLSEGIDLTRNISPFRYFMVRSVDFYAAAHQELNRQGVTFLQGAGEVQDGPHTCTIRVNGQEYSVDWAFDSRIRSQDLVPRPGYNHLRQHFLGWEVQTEHPLFDPGVVTMFDLRTPQPGGLAFYYTLPFSETRALVEYTLFSAELLPPDSYETSLREYLERMGAGRYSILESESGVIPMTDQPFPRRLGRRVLAIGTRGGRVKPSTGYAFARIQRDSERIVASLLRRDHPFAIPPDPLRYRLHDAIMLEILAKEPRLGRPIFNSIFSNNPAPRILRFLDDRSSLLDDLAVMTSHEPGPFIRAIGRRLRAWMSRG